MKLCRRTRGDAAGRAFTVLELMVVLLIVIVFVGLLLPTLSRGTNCSLRIKCVNNLKQNGIAFRIWADDNGERLPMEVSTNLGGAKEFVGAGEVFRVFQAMSNEISNPKMVVCPLDERTSATNWGSDLDNIHVSYFIGLNANQSLTNSFLSGDRNLQNRQEAQNGILEFKANQSVSWGTNMHNGNGNLLFADGRAEQLSSGGVRKVVANTGLATNRLVFP